MSERDDELGEWADSGPFSYGLQVEIDGPKCCRCSNFLYIFSLFCKNKWSVRNFAKLYICRRGPRR
jgi:hypothetical protein